MFSTVTNTNHDTAALAYEATDLSAAGASKDHTFAQAYTQIIEQGRSTTALSPRYFEQKYGADLNSVVQLAVQGVKGASAYAEHAYRLAKFASLSLESLEKCSEKLFSILHYF